MMTVSPPKTRSIRLLSSWPSDRCSFGREGSSEYMRKNKKTTKIKKNIYPSRSTRQSTASHPPIIFFFLNERTNDQHTQTHTNTHNHHASHTNITARQPGGYAVGNRIIIGTVRTHLLFVQLTPHVLCIHLIPRSR